MKILHIVGTISPAAGGPTEAIRMLVRYAPKGYSSEIATLDDPAALFLQDLPCPVHALGGSIQRWYAPRFEPWLREHGSSFDGVLVHGLWEHTGWGTMRALGGRVPYVVFAHGMLDPWFKRTYPLKHLKKWIYWLPIEYWVLRRAHRVLFTTTLERDLAAQSFRLHRWKALVVPLGSEEPPAEQSELLATFYEQHPALAGKRFLLFLGRIHPKKGCDLLLRAFARVANTVPDLHLVMAGPDPGHWRAELEKLLPTEDLQQRVHWTGMLQGHVKWGALAASEAFVLPSHQENFGIAAVEALASGKPVLLTDPVNLSPEIAAERCGLVEPDTLEGTYRLLDRWLAMSCEARQVMGRRARETFEQFYDMRKNTEAILRAFDTNPEQVAPVIGAPDAEAF